MTFPCPDCPREFDSERGMKTHFAHEHSSGEEKTYVCVWCSGRFSANEYNIGEYPTCSEACRSAWQSERRSGENAPNWKGGKGEKRGKEWDVLARFIRRRDGGCLNCGRDKTKSGRRLHVHHVTPADEFNAEQDAHQPTNLVALCFSCHKQFEGQPPDEQLEQLGVASREELEFDEELRENYESFLKRFIPKLRAPTAGGRENERCSALEQTNEDRD